MKILIVEDDKNKLKQLVAFLIANPFEAEIYEAYSYNSGLKQLLAETFDLVILDMSLPTYDTTVDESGGRPRSFAGLEILQMLKRKQKFIKAIVFTQFDVFGEGEKQVALKDLDSRLSSDYPESYRGSIYYSASSNDWRTKLQSLILDAQGE